MEAAAFDLTLNFEFDTVGSWSVDLVVIVVVVIVLLLVLVVCYVLVVVVMNVVMLMVETPMALLDINYQL